MRKLWVKAWLTVDGVFDAATMVLHVTMVDNSLNSLRPIFRPFSARSGT
jgi:hypothetical protein